MDNKTRLRLIKWLHTVIWLFFNVVIFYFLYAVIVNKIDTMAWVCLSLIAAECMVLLVFKNLCPVTIVARKYSSSDRANFDIYLPEWIAKHNKKIYGAIVFVALVIL